MKELILFGEKFVITPERDAYNYLRKDFRKSSQDAAERYMEKYKKYGSLEAFYKYGLNDGLEIIDNAWDAAVTILIDNGILDIDKETFIKKFYSPYYTWDDDFEYVNEQYMKIIYDQKEMDAYRTSRRQNRGKWRGGGFGLEGAIKGAAQAGALNVASGLAHGAVNVVGKSFSLIAESAQKSKVYNSTQNKNRLKQGIFNNCFSVHLALVSALIIKAGIPIDYVQDGSEEKVKIYLNNLKNPSFPQDKIKDTVREIFELFPYNPDVYEYLLKNYPNESQNILELAEYFGVDIESYVEKLLGRIKENYLNVGSGPDKLLSLYKGKEDFVLKAVSLGIEQSKYVKKELDIAEEIILNEKERLFRELYNSLGVTSVESGYDALRRLDEYSQELKLDQSNKLLSEAKQNISDKIYQLKIDGLRKYSAALDISSPEKIVEAINTINKYCLENKIESCPEKEAMLSKLKDERESLLIRQLDSKKSLLDFSSEERSIQALEELKKYAEELGLSADNLVIKEACDIVDYFDINARTFHGLIFEDRKMVKQAEMEAPMYDKLLDRLDYNDLKTFDEVLLNIESLENTSGIKDSYINFIHTQKNLLILEKEYPYALIPKDLVDMFTTVNGYKNGIKLDFLISRLHNSTIPEQKLAHLQSEEYQKAYELAEKYAKKEKTTFWGVVGSILGCLIIFLLISFLLGLILPGISVLIAAVFTAFSVIMQIKENSDINSKGKNLWQQLTNNGQFELREYE